MRELTKITGIVALLILIVLGLLAYANTANASNNLVGFWSASEEFCKTAQISFIWLYVNTNKLAWLIIRKDDKDVVNQVTHVRLNLSLSSLFQPVKQPHDYMSGSIHFIDIDSPQFPPSQTCRLYPHIGRLLLYGHDDVYADLYKNTRLSAISSDTNVPDDTPEQSPQPAVDPATDPMA